MGDIVPTKGNLIATKKSSDLSRLGFELMDKKRSILVKELNLIVNKALSTKKEIKETYKSAAEFLKMANVTLYADDSFFDTVPVDNGIKVSYRSVMGVEIPVVSVPVQSEIDFSYGFYNSNSFLDEAFKRFFKVKMLASKLAELEISVYRLTNAIEKTRKRANALKNVIIPKFERSIKYISDSLEEKEREEFSRLKVIKNKKY